RQERELHSHGRGFNTVSVLPNGREALSGGSDATMLLQEIEKSQEIRRFSVKQEAQRYWVYRLAVSPDGKNAASFSFVPSRRKALVQVWDLGKEKPLITREDVSPVGDFPHFSPDGVSLVRYSTIQPRLRAAPAQLGQGAPPVEGPSFQVIIQE